MPGANTLINKTGFNISRSSKAFFAFSNGNLRIKCVIDAPINGELKTPKQNVKGMKSVDNCVLIKIIVERIGPATTETTKKHNQINQWVLPGSSFSFVLFIVDLLVNICWLVLS